MDKIRVVFMGTPRYAEQILLSLLEADDLEVVAVYTQPDRPVGRKRVLTPPPVKVLAADRGIAVRQPETLRDAAVQEELVSFAPDFIVVAAYGLLLPEAVLSVAPCINLHASLLPRYRGASPVQEAILQGDRYTGVTAMLMERGLDTGPTLVYRILEIGETTDTSALMERLGDAAAGLTVEVLRRFDTLQPIPQFGALASHCRKITRQDGRYRGSHPGELLRTYPAYTPRPGIHFPSGLKLLEIALSSPEGAGDAGRILSVGEEGIEVSCRNGAIRIVRVQPPGKRAMDARSYCVGRGLKVGDSIL